MKKMKLEEIGVTEEYLSEVLFHTEVHKVLLNFSQ